MNGSVSGAVVAVGVVPGAGAGAVVPGPVGVVPGPVGVVPGPVGVVPGGVAVGVGSVTVKHSPLDASLEPL